MSLYSPGSLDIRCTVSPACLRIRRRTVQIEDGDRADRISLLIVMARRESKMECECKRDDWE